MPAVRAPDGAAVGRLSPAGTASRLNHVYEHVDPSHSIRYTGRIRERAQRRGEGGELSEITKAMKARQDQPTAAGELSSEDQASVEQVIDIDPMAIERLQRVARGMAPPVDATVKTTKELNAPSGRRRSA